MNIQKLQAVIKCIHIIFLSMFLIILAESNSHAQKRILVLGWNVESGGNDPTTIAKQLADLEGYDIIGLCEVKASNAPIYGKAAAFGEGAKNSNPDFQHRVSTTGRGDRLMIIWDAKRFDLIGNPVELHSLNDQNRRHRSPFFAHFKLQNTNIEFLFMVNHLARGDETLRQRQATGLSTWANQQTLPIIAVGDYNFDYSIDDGEGNLAMQNMLSTEVFEWVKPSELYQTGLHSKFYSVLDFVFIGNKPANWSVNSKILKENFPYPDNIQTSDHRPIQGLILID